MIKNFVYNIYTKVYFGEGLIEGNLGRELSAYGKKVLLCYGGGSVKRSGLYDRVVKEIKDNGMELFELSGIEPNPRIESVRRGVEICKKEGIDVLLAVGGGSTMDCAKFVAAGAKLEEGRDPWEIFEGKVKIKDALPLCTVLTIAATGSEMDQGGVITNLSINKKLGMKAECLRPRVSFEDPTITYSVPAYQTACGSADILSHILETYFNEDDNFMFLDNFMEGLMQTVIKYAPIAIKDPTNYEARAHLMWASSWAINDFNRMTHVRSWSCHSMEHELSAYYDITHGLGLAILTPRWMNYVLDETSVDRFYQLGRRVFDLDKSDDKMAVARKTIELFTEFFSKGLGLDDTLTKIGIGEEHFDEMAEAASKTLQKVYRPLSKEDVKNIYKMCL